MRVTVVKSRQFSQVFGQEVLTELAFPLREIEEAVKMFKEEYPKYNTITAYTFESDERPDLYNAFNDAGCVRFF